MLTIWGRLSSINVQKVVICANELGLAYERIDAGGPFGGLDTPEALARNPNKLIPVIRDGDFVLWESNAIVRYLARVYGAGTLWPEDPRVVADADRWMDWQSLSLNPALVDAFLNTVRAKPGQAHQAALDASVAKTEPLLALLDAHLATRAYVAGDYSMGDIPVACSAHRWYGLPLARRAHPNVEAWLARLRARPAYASVLTYPLA
ncbi:MAG TPA: glutathione S-transferase N-terminal domain-containing protein [Casimicrobiaceae bacterium]|nr:glutathione S-transferase N-terminal domain-containing protein [Casimicrobiaceae bacterium]